jgi:universal stress protein F
MNRILVCLDSSPRAAFVLQTAAELAKRTGAKLRLLRAVGLPPEIDQEMFVHSAANVIDTLKEKARNELGGLARRAPEAAIEAMDVIIGTPWDAICREAKSVDADLVIIGSHGYSGFDRILGTTAGKVVNHCDRSVLVVRNVDADKNADKK